MYVQVTKMFLTVHWNVSEIFLLCKQVPNPKVDKLVIALNKAVTLVLEVGKRVEIWDQPSPAVFAKLGVTLERESDDGEYLENDKESPWEIR